MWGRGISSPFFLNRKKSEEPTEENFKNRFKMTINTKFNILIKSKGWFVELAFLLNW